MLFFIRKLCIMFILQLERGGVFMHFEILCLDNAEAVKSRSVRTLLYALMANDSLFDEVEANEQKGEIKEKKRPLLLRVNQFPTDKMLTGARYSVAFTISVESDELATLDIFRVQLVDYIKSLGFSNIRILLDEVSEHLAESLYPKLYRLENKVRAFVINFFLKNLGTHWTRLAMSVDTLEKIKNRKKNDRIFISSGKVESDVMLIDFDDLGRILYNENSILSNKRADNVAILIEKISAATDLEVLKKDVLEGNFYKYFKDCFTQKDFQNKWFDLYYYRNKLAHNGYFSQSEVDMCSSLCDDISSIIDTAYEKLDTFKLSASDQEALMEAVNEFASESSSKIDSHHGTPYVAISEDELIKELGIAQERLPFVGLRYFVTEWLGEKGYDYDASFTLINYLEDKGVIKLSKIKNPASEYQTTAISTI